MPHDGDSMPHDGCYGWHKMRAVLCFGNMNVADPGDACRDPGQGAPMSKFIEELALMSGVDKTRLHAVELFKEYVYKASAMTHAMYHAVSIRRAP